MKLTFAAVAAVIICLFSLAARSTAMSALAKATPEKAYLEEERLALDAIDGRLRAKLQRLANR